jgi:NAD(P)-dependent dehydrogenase (short-subunit alcohol dehydrogenase family)
LSKKKQEGKNMDYTNKVVLVTGGANGIGRAISKAYCEKGATVIIADIDEKNGLWLEKEYKDLRLKAYFYKIDLQNSEEIIAMFDSIIKQYEKIDILINNAGISKFKSLYELTVKEWDEIINVNLRSAFITSREFAKYNKNTTYGRIINIASTRYIMSEPNSEAYAASKGGIVSLTHALALSLSKENITVNSISPGWIQNTNYERLRPIDHSQHPSLRVGKPEDIARACLFLTDEKNDFINGENIVIDGGMTKKMIYED